MITPGYTVRPTQFDFGSMMWPLMQLMIVMVFASMVMKWMQEPEPRLPAGYKPLGMTEAEVARQMRQPTPPKVATRPLTAEEKWEERERELEEKKRELEAEGRRIAAEAGGGVRFLRLDKDWQLKFWRPRFWFIDPEGMEIVAEDAEELKWKLQVTGREVG